MATPGQDDQPAPGEMGDDRAIIRGVIEPPRTAGPVEHLSARPLPSYGVRRGIIVRKRSLPRGTRRDLLEGPSSRSVG